MRFLESNEHEELARGRVIENTALPIGARSSARVAMPDVQFLQLRVLMFLIGNMR
jgi:hypothetical protein